VYIRLVFLSVRLSMTNKRVHNVLSIAMVLLLWQQRL